MVDETAIGRGGRAFPTTRWSLIVASREPEPRRAALSELLATYWKPLYFYARRKGLTVEAAKDAVQGFFAHLLEGDFLERLDPGKGSFRAYLRMALDHHLANQREAQAALKRGGGARTVSLDFDVAETQLASALEEPASAYDHEWALGVMERALGKLEREHDEGARKGRFETVRRFFATSPEENPGAPPSYSEAAAACGLGVPAFKALLHRTRARFRRLVREEIAETVSPGSGDIEAEISHLLEALR
ncbi:sigma-70 family RNA polymerase sigma factor [bacterium]|nr:sigma-70 family RNA polymerase sigma factor [bacterium]